IFRLAIFVLAIFVGYYVVWSVTPALHTPLMSATNAISPVIIAGALIAVGLDLSQAGETGSLSKAFGFVAAILAAVSICGGFVLAILVGYYVVWSVTPALHTPLMSVTNAISSVIIVGALIAVGLDLSQAGETGWLSKGFGFVAVILAAVNIFGGFLVTQRMLAMYKKKQR